VLVEGTIVPKSFASRTRNFYLVEYELLEDIPPDDREREALSRALLSRFEEYVKLNKKIPPEILTSLAGIDDLGRLADTIAAHMSIKVEEKQKILEEQHVKPRLQITLTQLESEIDLWQVEKRIQNNVKKQWTKASVSIISAKK